MTELDPSFITAANWQELSRLLGSLWMILGSALGFGGSLLMANGVVPSLASTGDLPNDAMGKARAPFFAAGLVFLVMGLVSVFLFLDRLEVITDIFYKGAI